MLMIPLLAPLMKLPTLACKTLSKTTITFSSHQRLDKHLLPTLTSGFQIIRSFCTKEPSGEGSLHEFDDDLDEPPSKNLKRHLLRNPEGTLMLGLNNASLDEEEDLLDNKHEILNHRSFKLADMKRVAILQPWVKWGKSRRWKTTKSSLMAEARALVLSIPGVDIAYEEVVPVVKIMSVQVFTSGTYARVLQVVKSTGCDAVFICVDLLRVKEVLILEEDFGMKVFDRYMVVLEIFRHYARSPEALTQIELAEMRYTSRYVLNNTQKLEFHAKKAEVKRTLEKIRKRREKARDVRRSNFLNSVAIVGYTNCGKTSLIGILTGDEKIQGEDRLFATLEVTTHGAPLPSGLNITVVDTVGFIQQIPKSLLDAFQSTLQDAAFADVIVYMRDISHEDFVVHDDTVRETLKTIGIPDSTPIVIANNKCDLLTPEQLENNIQRFKASDGINTSCLTGEGLEKLLYTIESKVLQATGRKRIRMRLPVGSSKIKWLEKNMAVTSCVVDEEKPEFMVLELVMNKVEIDIFRHQFAR